MCNLNEENLKIYNQTSEVPKEAQREIQGGRLKGMTDINPMWRIKTLTNMFGPCGFGWTSNIKKMWLENGTNGEVVAFCEIELKVKWNEQWSEGITGIGGSMIIVGETKGLRTDDEAYKKAYTDALSVACKQLGIGGNVYWNKDPDKYIDNETLQETKQETNTNRIQEIKELIIGTNLTNADITAKIKTVTGEDIKVKELTEEQYNKVLKAIMEEIKGASINE